ncbi:MAG: gamma-glutamyl-gamma-aminobutyrate hydrolase family protein [Kiritimatiellae bacterium]|nr:gamma-glutamyl-gamma-aminobutyrate hydrolase family protein [Kiritimatiellia bacterium]
MMQTMKMIGLAVMMGCSAMGDSVRPLVVGIADMCPPENDGRDVTVRAQYAEAVSKGGNLPVVIPRFGTDAQLDAILSRVDLVLFAGGEDVAPARYREKESPKLGTVNLTRDAFEFRLLAIARKRGLPIVGICRGCQLVNVAFGGTLWQDLPSEFPAENVQHRGVSHAITILPDSCLARMIGKTEVTVNSSHHQAVKEAAPGFRIVARSPEGVPEAIEAADYPALGVQFHPERLVVEDKNPVFERFFRNFHLTLPVDQAKSRQ